jgi:hypothetical protein
VISNTRAAVSAYAEAITDGIQDRLRLRLFESIWAQGRCCPSQGPAGSARPGS